MSNLVSINVQEIEPAQSVHHSARSKTVSYLVAEPNTITTYRHDLQSINIDKSNLDNVRDYFELRTSEINTDYKQNHNNRNIKKDTKLYQEAVISFGREQFENCAQSEMLKSIDSFCNNFEQKYGCKVLLSSLHLDEGHKTETGEILHNYHAHVLIENYSFDTHKTCLQKLDYRKLQTELANEFKHLGFERGKDYTALQLEENKKAKEDHRKPEKVKPERLEHREYRQMKENESGMPLELENIQLKESMKNIESIVSVADQTNNELKTDNYEKFIQIAQLHEQLRLAKEQYDADRRKLKESGEAKQADYQQLKVDYEKLKSEIEASKIEIDTKLQNIEVLQAKVTVLENERLTKSFENFKPTFTREEVELAKEVALEAETFGKNLNPLKGLLYVCEINGKTMTPKELKQEHERLTQAKTLAIDKLETDSNELAKTLEKTTQQLASSTETAERLKDANQKYWQVRTENIDLRRENLTLKSIEGKEPQDMQAQIVKQSEEIRTLSSEKSSLEYTKKSQEKQIDELKAQHKQEVSELKTENKTHINAQDTKIQEQQKQIDKLKTENSALENALERFLDLPMVKAISDASKSILDRFMDGLGVVSDALDKLKIKTPEILSAKYILTDALTGTKIGLNTNAEALKYFEQYDKGNAIPGWIKADKVKTEDSFHFLDDENPVHLATVLNREFKTEIKVQSVEKIKALAIEAQRQKSREIEL